MITLTYPQIRQWIPLVSLTMLLIFLQSYNDILRYEQKNLLNGQFWRLWTGNFVHLNFTHLFMNISGLWLINFIFSQRFLTWKLYIDLFLLSSVIGIALLIFSPEIQWYVGLSGALYGLLVIGSIDLIKKKEYLIGGLSLLFAWGKVFLEQYYGGSDFNQQLIQSRVVIDAHLYGMLAGLFLAFRPVKCDQHQQNEHNSKH